ncbi:hypothetical protein [Anaeromicrobium sediminis]|uniref:Uncharacterized protein n=1 Tax=Anaeromicrobium sediminis TaxID=1478221 RepID=A0A267ME48_9FIRM|nr:hypothetical protein [Anaeromicrobium sediminis]PAB57854.1 hypothetical protein CCE28_17800 [Anaeromicrobium sediminis]
MICHEGISYLDSDDVYYYYCHVNKNEIEKYRNKWYKVKCVIRLGNIPDHMNIYFIPQPKLEHFLKNNPEKLLDIQPTSYEEIKELLLKYNVQI